VAVAARPARPARATGAAGPAAAVSARTAGAVPQALGRIEALLTGGFVRARRDARRSAAVDVLLCRVARRGQTRLRSRDVPATREVGLASRPQGGSAVAVRVVSCGRVAWRSVVVVRRRARGAGQKGESEEGGL